MNRISAEVEFFRQLEEKLIKPVTRQSITELAALLADSFIEYGSSGRIYYKPDVVTALQSTSPSQITITDFHVRKLGTDAVLVTYKATRLGSGTDAATHSLRSSIWQCIAGQWQIVFHQGTPTN